jgi:branched-chain amino acid transport system ATP-binding protein
MAPMAEAPPLLLAEALGMRFGDFRALSDLTLAVAPGSLHAIIGPNGAGKTTLFNVLTGRLRPSSGRISFAGRDVTRLPAHRRVHLGMARSFQVTNLFAELSVAENLRLAVQAVAAGEPWVFWRGQQRLEDRVAALLEEVGLSGRAGWRAGDLSHGGQRALEIGMALAADPRIVFLDEPLAGMGIDDVHRTKELIHALVPDRTVVLIEHNMRVVLNIADRITVLAQGRPIAEGPPAVIRGDAAVREAYLGSGM